jgi:ABC-type sugar transport system permease subunit
MSWLIAWLFWRQFVATLAWVLLTLVLCVLLFLVIAFLGDVLREFMQRLCAALL